MSDLAPFPDLEAALIELFADLGTADTETPSTLDSNLPFIRVGRIGGNDNFFTDSGRMDVDTYAEKRTQASLLSRQIRQRLGKGAIVLSSCVIDTVTVDVSPNEVPWGNSKISYFTASYRITARR